MLNKARVSIACAVVGLGVVAGLPVVTGSLAEKTVHAEVGGLAERAGYQVGSLELDRGYGSTEVSVQLIGEGVRSLNGEMITLTGTIEHGSVLTLPAMANAALDVQLQIGGGEDVHIYSGVAQGELLWSGRRKLTLDVDSSVIALDEYEGVMAAVDGHTLSYDSADRQGGWSRADMSDVSVLISDPATVAYRVDFQPSSVRWQDGGSEWEFQVPRLDVFVDESVEPLASVDEFKVLGSEVEDEGVVASRFGLSSGEIKIQGRDEPLVKSVSLYSRLDNISVDGAVGLFEAIQKGDEGQDDFVAAFLDILDQQPSYTLEEFRVDTGSGELSVNFTLGAGESAGDVARSLFSGAAGVDGDMAFIQSLYGSAEIRVDDELIVTGCRQGMAMAAPGVAGSEVAVEMCAGVVRGGHFLTPGCAPGDAVCLDKANQMRQFWQDNGSLQVDFDGQQVTINDVEMNLLEALIMFM